MMLYLKNKLNKYSDWNKTKSKVGLLFVLCAIIFAITGFVYLNRFASSKLLTGYVPKPLPCYSQWQCLNENDVNSVDKERAQIHIEKYLFGDDGLSIEPFESCKTSKGGGTFSFLSKQEETLLVSCLTNEFSSYANDDENTCLSDEELQDLSKNGVICSPSQENAWSFYFATQRNSKILDILLALLFATVVIFDTFWIVNIILGKPRNAFRFDLFAVPIEHLYVALLLMLVFIFECNFTRAFYFEYSCHQVDQKHENLLDTYLVEDENDHKQNVYNVSLHVDYVCDTLVDGMKNSVIGSWLVLVSQFSLIIAMIAQSEKTPPQKVVNQSFGNDCSSFCCCPSFCLPICLIMSSICMCVSIGISMNRFAEFCTLNVRAILYLMGYMTTKEIQFSFLRLNYIFALLILMTISSGFSGVFVGVRELLSSNRNGNGFFSSKFRKFTMNEESSSRLFMFGLINLVPSWMVLSIGIISGTYALIFGLSIGFSCNFLFNGPSVIIINPLINLLTANETYTSIFKLYWFVSSNGCDSILEGVDVVLNFTENMADDFQQLIPLIPEEIFTYLNKTLDDFSDFNHMLNVEENKCENFFSYLAFKATHDLMNKTVQVLQHVDGGDGVLCLNLEPFGIEFNQCTEAVKDFCVDFAFPIWDAGFQFFIFLLIGYTFYTINLAILPVTGAATTTSMLYRQYGQKKQNPKIMFTTKQKEKSHHENNTDEILNENNIALN